MAQPTDEQGRHDMTDSQHQRRRRCTAARQVRIGGASSRLLAFAQPDRAVRRSSRSPRRTSCRPTNILAHPAGDRGQRRAGASAATLVIITGGIDLSVGTLMTFCAVIAGVVHDLLGPAAAAGHARRPSRTGALLRPDLRHRRSPR
ncbi:MAG: hypothetical protein V9G20_29755 [Candidatus Promineifilaceae bacterium]